MELLLLGVGDNEEMVVEEENMVLDGVGGCGGLKRVKNKVACNRIEKR